MKKINALLLIILTLISSCVKPAYIPKEVNIIQHALRSTVKIRAMVTGLKVNVSKETKEPISEEVETKSWVGSGVITKVDVKTNKSLILTANHVATQPRLSLSDDGDTVGLFILQEIILNVETYDGRTCSAKTIKKDEANDLAAIVADCVAGFSVEIADQMPNIGERVLISGAPLGYHPKNIFAVVEGFYLGNADNENEIFSAPVISGMSGSGVLYDGKLISILSMRVGDYEHISICTNYKDLIKIQAEAEAIF